MTRPDLIAGWLLNKRCQERMTDNSLCASLYLHGEMEAEA
jgi:hypothetical protein